MEVFAIGFLSQSISVGKIKSCLGILVRKKERGTKTQLNIALRYTEIAEDLSNNVAEDEGTNYGVNSGSF